MKTNPFKYYAVAICLCANFVMLAQLPGAEDNNGGLEGAETPVAPIDGYVWVLATIGLTYVFLRLRAFANQGNSAKNK
ncbi:hypothetical protein [Flavobacterium sp.]|jgi:hypothetical protein|uniref:hypothetical protein n=1 Tax=Flavobacterium sp. TaxID=239 RepID=UPI0037BF51F6